MEYYECKSDELMHYGRKGMKWGYHKFHNDDGSLNAIGKQKFDKVSKSKIRTYANKARAIESYRVSKEYANNKNKLYTHKNKRLNKKLNRFDKKIAKKVKKGKYKNSSQVVKDSNRRNKLIMDSSITKQRARDYLKKSKIMEKKISDIKNEKIKAGKDYIAEYEFNPNSGYNELNVYDRYGNNTNKVRIIYC